MATTYSPKIPTDSLVMYVDAANPKSYPGSGTTWYDLTSNGHNISLGSTVELDTYNDTSVLHFPEDANGYGRNTSMNLASSNYTVISFLRKLNANDGRTITAYSNNWLLGSHDTTYGDYYAEGWIYNGAGTADTNWRMYAGTGDISGDSFNLYINDSQIVNGSNGGSAGPNGWNLNNQYSQYSNCEIANLICYNRVLTDAEINRVYNTFKGRFGI